MRQGRGGAFSQQAGHRRQAQRHLAQHRNVVGRQRAGVGLGGQHAHPAHGLTGVQRQVGLGFDQRLLRDKFNARLLCAALVQGGIGLEPDGVKKAGLDLRVGLPEQRWRELVAFPKFVGEGANVALPAHRAKQKAPIGQQVIGVNRQLVA